MYFKQIKLTGMEVHKNPTKEIALPVVEFFFFLVQKESVEKPTTRRIA